MDASDSRALLSSVDVEWSQTERVFIARSPQAPGMDYRDESALVAIDGLLETVLKNRDSAPRGTLF